MTESNISEAQYMYMNEDDDDVFEFLDIAQSKYNGPKIRESTRKNNVLDYLTNSEIMRIAYHVRKWDSGDKKYESVASRILDDRFYDTLTLKQRRCLFGYIKPYMEKKRPI